MLKLRGRRRVVAQLATDTSLAATRAAVRCGEVSLAHAQVIRGTVAALPAGVRGEAEAFLLGEAPVFDPRQLAKLGQHLRHVVDPDAGERAEQAAHRKRELSLVDRGDGTHRLRGILDREAAATLHAVLDPLAAPRPAADGTPDPRTGPQRYADALVTALRSLLDAGDRLPPPGAPART